MDGGHLERLGIVQLGKDAGQARRQHRLSGPWRPDHRQVVSAGGGHLERPPGGALADDLAQVGGRRLGRRLPRLGRRRRRPRVAQPLDHCGQRLSRQYLGTGYQRRLGSTGRRHHDPVHACCA
jgi:hypothetical protein